jgi:hypothetical protein
MGSSNVTVLLKQQQTSYFNLNWETVCPQARPHPYTRNFLLPGTWRTWSTGFEAKGRAEGAKEGFDAVGGRVEGIERGTREGRKELSWGA